MKAFFMLLYFVFSVWGRQRVLSRCSWYYWRRHYVKVYSGKNILTFMIDFFLKTKTFCFQFILLTIFWGKPLLQVLPRNFVNKMNWKRRDLHCFLKLELCQAFLQFKFFKQIALIIWNLFGYKHYRVSAMSLHCLWRSVIQL